jgi:rhodanese-related sulfurtransferase
MSAVSLPGVPEERVAPLKRTDAALYLTAAQAYQLQQSRQHEVVLIDIRGQAEVMFAGQPDGVDLHVPYAELAYPLTQNVQQWQRNPTFIADVEAALQRRNVDIAADALAAAGFTRVYTVIDGFEGDVGASGRRDLNGWKNAGAPWRAGPARLAYGVL